MPLRELVNYPLLVSKVYEVSPPRNQNYFRNITVIHGCHDLEVCLIRPIHDHYVPLENFPCFTTLIALRTCPSTCSGPWRVLQLYCRPPTTLCSIQQRIKPMTIYRYGPEEQCWTKRLHQYPLEWQPQFKEKRLQWKDRPIPPITNMWSHERSTVLFKPVTCERFVDYCQRVTGQHCMHAVPTQTASFDHSFITVLSR